MRLNFAASSSKVRGYRNRRHRQTRRKSRRQNVYGPPTPPLPVIVTGVTATPCTAVITMHLVVGGPYHALLPNSPLQSRHDATLGFRFSRPGLRALTLLLIG